MGKYVQIEKEGTITLTLPPELAERRAEVIERLEERFGFEGLTADAEAEIDAFVRELVESDAS